MSHLDNLIDYFLDGHRESDGGWGQVTPEDVNDLYDIVRELIRLKSDPDPDGCYPIEFTIVNRRVYESLQYEPVPYRHQGDNMRILMGNLSLAFHRLDTEYRCESSELERLRDIKLAMSTYAQYVYQVKKDGLIPVEEEEGKITQGQAQAALDQAMKLARKP